MSTPCPKPPKRVKKQGGGLTRNKALEGGKPLRQVSKKREAWLEENNLPLTTFGRRTGKDRLQKQGMRWHRSTSAWVTPRRLTAATSRKLRKVLAKVGQRGKRLAPLDQKFRDDIWGVWPECPFTGYDRASKRCEVHHCKDKSAHDDWRYALWNGIPIYIPIHQLVDPLPELKRAFERVANEQKAAAEGLRPDVTPGEVRAIVLAAVPDLYEQIGWAPKAKRNSLEAS